LGQSALPAKGLQTFSKVGSDIAKAQAEPQPGTLRGTCHNSLFAVARSAQHAKRKRICMKENGPFFGIDVPLMRLLGLQAHQLDPATSLAQTRLPQRQELRNSHGAVHGGTLMSVLDFTMSAAARAHDPLGIGVITIDMTTHFLSPARGDLTFKASATKRGNKITFCEGSAYNASGDLVCTARVVFKLVPVSVA
jgi:uncharacterized protein (TIGR00369 family)